MKNLFCLIILLLLFSCKKEDNVSILAESELWLKVSSSIESLDVSFTGENANGILHLYKINYNKGVFVSKLKTANDTKDSETWTRVYASNEKSAEILVTCKNKDYRIRGFSFNEKRLLEIVNSFDATITIYDRDISVIENIIVID